MGYYCTVAVDFCESLSTEVSGLLSDMSKEDQEFWKSWAVIENETYLFKEISMHPRLPYVHSFYRLFDALNHAGQRNRYKYIVLHPGLVEESGYFEEGRLKLVRKIDFKPGA